MTEKKSGKRVTLYDVAKAAGVSHQTVSRVINNYPHISTTTRNKVLRAIRELGYQPNRAAQMLNTQRSYLLEVIMLNIWGSNAPTIAEMAETARNLGYQLTISVVAADEVMGMIQTARSRLIDGLILSAERFEIPANALSEVIQMIPIVKIRGEPHAQMASVIYDQQHGAQLATQHLIDLGHQHIAEISGPHEMYDARARHMAWQDTLHAHDLEPGPTAYGSFTERSGYEAMRQLIASEAHFTAVFAGNDSMAVGAMYALHEHGWRVPDDISLVGFDDIPSTPYYTAPLTTIRQDARQIGRLAIEYLVALIEQSETSIHQRVLLPELIVRQSTRTLT